MAKSNKGSNEPNEGDLNAQYQSRKALLSEINDLENESSKSISNAIRLGKSYLKTLQNKKALEKEILSYENLINSGKSNGQKLTQGEISLLKSKTEEYKRTLALTNENLKALNKTKVVLGALTNEAANFGNNLNVYDFLISSDSAIKSLNLNLGISGQLAATTRSNIQGISFEVATLGISIENLTQIQSAYSEETGKIVPLSQSALKNISLIATSTGIAASEAGNLAGQFNQIGLGAEATASFVQETLNKSEQIGISGVKAVKTITSNFDKLSKYNFRNGVESFRNMVQFSQQVNQNLEGVFTAAEKFRTLEGAITASAELQTLGGNFAKADAFTMGFLSRNDPEKFAEKLNEMVQGLYTFNKQTGQMQISSVNLDRLRQAAEITGQSFEDLSVQARKASEVQFIGSKTIGLSKDDKALVAQLAQMNSQTKHFQVDIGGNKIDIENISSQQLKLLKEQQASLEQRSKASQTFDQTFQNTVMQLKSALLPTLNLINKGLELVNSTGDGWLGVVTKLVALGGGAMLLKGISSNLGTLATSIVKAPFSALGGGASKGIGSAIGGKVADVAGGAGKAAGSLGDGLSKIPEGSSLSSKAKGIAAIGLAAVGIGVGIYLATKGVSAMADSFSKLNPDQLKYVAISLGVLTLGLTALGIAGSFAGPGVIAFGAGVALIGVGIGIAAAGVGYMAEGFSSLADPKIGSSMMSIAGGMTSIAASSAIFANPLTLAGLAGVSMFMNSVKGIDFGGMNGAFSQANQFMQADDSNLKLLRETLNMLKSNDKNMFSELKQIIDKGIEVKMSTKDVNLTTNITLTMDGDVIAKKLNIGSRATMEIVNARRGT